MQGYILHRPVIPFYRPATQLQQSHSVTQSTPSILPKLHGVAIDLVYNDINNNNNKSNNNNNNSSSASTELVPDWFAIIPSLRELEDRERYSIYI